MKILLPVDGTELSLHETRFALSLVREGLRASFVLANVQEPASFYEIVTAQNPGLIESAAQEAGEDLIAPSARLLTEAGVPFETAVITGDPAHARQALQSVFNGNPKSPPGPRGKSAARARRPRARRAA